MSFCVAFVCSHLLKRKIHLCLRVQWNIRRRNEAHHLGMDVGSRGKNGPNLGVGLFGDGGGL